MQSEPTRSWKVWPLSVAQAPKLIQRDTLRLISQAIYVDIGVQRVVCVKPYPEFVPLFRMDGLTEREGCFYVEEEQEAGAEG